MKIQVLSDAVQTREFPARDGKPAISFRQQDAAIIRDGQFPLPFKMPLRADQRAYGPGFYEFGPESFSADEYGRLKFTRDLSLVAVTGVKG